MRFYFYITGLLIVVLLLFISCSKEKEGGGDNFSQRKSPVAIATAKHGDTYVKIVYGQPYKQGREIFGRLVPYNEVWRTGANEATELTTTGRLMFGDKELAPGTYTLFTIPREETWTVILNSELGQWGAFEYHPSMDVLRIDVPATQTGQIAEAFTIQFGEITNDTSSIIMHWDDTEVHIPISFLGSPGSET